MNRSYSEELEVFFFLLLLLLQKLLFYIGFSIFVTEVFTDYVFLNTPITNFVMNCA